MTQSLVDCGLQTSCSSEVPLLSTRNTSGARPRKGTRSTALATELVVNPLTGFVGLARAGWLLLRDTAR